MRGLVQWTKVLTSSVGPIIRRTSRVILQLRSWPGRWTPRPPYEIETPPACGGWEDMYPYYARFDEERREADWQRFWFWNSMHFLVPVRAQ